MNENLSLEPEDAPSGFIKNAKGGFDPISTVKPIDLLRDQTVRKLFQAALELSDTVSTFKATALDEVGEFVDVSAEQHGVKLGGQKGNVTLTTYDGRFRVVRAISESVSFDEQLAAAKTLIDECIHDWSQTSNPSLVALVNDAFQVDKAGQVSTARILGLRRHNIEDDRWKRAMDAIADSVIVTGAKAYIRFYWRDEDGKYQPIKLDAAA